MSPIAGGDEQAGAGGWTGGIGVRRETAGDWQVDGGQGASKEIEPAEPLSLGKGSRSTGSDKGMIDSVREGRPYHRLCRSLPVHRRRPVCAVDAR